MKVIVAELFRLLEAPNTVPFRVHCTDANKAAWRAWLEALASSQPF